MIRESGMILNPSMHPSTNRSDYLAVKGLVHLHRRNVPCFFDDGYHKVHIVRMDRLVVGQRTKQCCRDRVHSSSMNLFKIASGIAPRNWLTGAPSRKAITVGRADTWIDRSRREAGIVVSESKSMEGQVVGYPEWGVIVRQ